MDPAQALGKAINDIFQNLKEEDPGIPLVPYNSRSLARLQLGKNMLLDVQVSVRRGLLAADFFCKPTDTHQLLHRKSCYPWHTKKATPYNQALRYRRI